MKTLIAILVMAVVLVVPAYFVYGGDDADKLSSNQSVFSPGYVNAAKYQAESLLKVKIPDYKEKGFFEKAVDHVKDKLGYNAKKQQAANQDLNPVLQQKSSQQDGAQVTVASLINSKSYNVNMGSGTNKIYEKGRLISEVINGSRHIYVGFNNAGKSNIGDALALAGAGDRIIVKSGKYNESVINIKDGVSMYGGYGENGRQDLLKTPTIINGKFIADSVKKATEISGFTVNVPPADTATDWGFFLSFMDPGYAFNIRSSSNITVRNNIFGGDANYGVYLNRSSAVIENNIFNSKNGIYVDGKNYSPGVRLVFCCCGAPPTTINANPVAPIIYTVISESNNFGGTQGIKVTSDNITISTQDDRYGEKIKEGDRLYYVNRSISIENGTVATTNNKVTIVREPRSVVVNNIKMFAASPYSIKTTKVDMDTVVSVFKELLEKKADVGQGQIGQISRERLVKTAEDSVNKMMPSSQGQAGVDERNVAMALACVVANPTKDQKQIIDSITSLLDDMKDLQGQTGVNPELQKASSDLLQMVASVLLAQAIPDLLKEGDMQGMKGVFSQLDSGKSKLLMEYKEATRPYYEEVKKLIEKNASAIDVDINMKKLFEKEVPRSEIDKILEKLKNKEKKTFEEEYILQEQEKAKTKYIDPSKKKLEEHMKQVLEEFTKRLSNTLEATKK